MSPLIISVTVAAIISWVAEYVVSRHSAKHLAASKKLARTNGELATGHACVILCIRGLDPTLRRTLKALCEQDHPDYSVLIVLDNSEDESVDIVRQIASEFENTQLEYTILEHVLPTSTRKLSSLNQAFDNLPEEAKVVVNIDADVVPTPDWLTRLSTALSHREVGVATAIRRYFPDSYTYPNLLRSFWSSFATNWTLLCQIGWGGSLAMRRELINDSRLRDRLRHGFSEDTIISQFARENGLAVRVIPGITQPNRDETSFPGLWNFLRRQLLAVKLHHRGWGILVLQGLTIAVSIICGLTWAAGATGALHFVTAALVVVYVSLGLMVVLPGPRIASTDCTGQLAYEPLRSFKDGVMFLLALVTMPLVYGAAIASTFFSRTHTWRDIRYRVRRGKPVETLSPIPAPVAASRETPHSATT